MDRCDPVEMRKNLVVVDAFERAGINFVAIPAMNESDKDDLIEMMSRRLSSIVLADEPIFEPLNEPKDERQ